MQSEQLALHPCCYQDTNRTRARLGKSVSIRREKWHRSERAAGEQT